MEATVWKFMSSGLFGHPSPFKQLSKSITRPSADFVSCILKTNSYWHVNSVQRVGADDEMTVVMDLGPDIIEHTFKPSGCLFVATRAHQVQSSPVFRM